MSKKEITVTKGIIIGLLVLAIFVPPLVHAGIGGTVKHAKNWHEYKPFDIKADMALLLDEGKKLQAGECIIFDRHRVCKIPRNMSFEQLCKDFYGSSDRETVNSVWKRAFANRELKNPAKIYEGEVFILPKDLLRD